jgi:hypothetical protein
MLRTSSAARWDAVHALQTKRARFSTNSIQHRTFDHAIDLALSPRRKDNNFLAWNASVDARKIIERKDRRDGARFPHPLYGTKSQPDSLAIGFESLAKFDSTYQAALSPTADNNLIWKQLYDKLVLIVGQRNAYAISVLNGWRDGEEVSETAKLLGISCAYVKKIRLMITRAALDMKTGDLM